MSRSAFSAILFLPIISGFRAGGMASCASNLLAAQRHGDLKMVTNGIIIGGGRIGEYLYELNGKKDRLIASRQDTVKESDPDGPIYVCTRNDDLDDIIAKTPERRRSDLVFLQNGMLGPYLKEKGFSDNTQGLIYFAISKKGETPIDGVTDVNPEGTRPSHLRN
jgi:hypothetical protein